MKKRFVSELLLKDLPLWEKFDGKRTLYSFEYETTARCNLNCRHCCINRPAGDRETKDAELSIEEIKRIAGEAVSLGAIWCLLTGGEPLLRKDFFDVYLALKKSGLLVSIFTNGTMITQEHTRFFKKYPPRGIEIPVYGHSQETYERVTRTPGSYNAFQRGLELLAKSKIPIMLKTMALRSNLHEMTEIIRFCRENGEADFRFDPFLHFRYDGNQERNREIQAERLTPEEIVALEMSDPFRLQALKKNCKNLIHPEFKKNISYKIFGCGIGKMNFCISPRGIFRFCSILWHPECIYNLRKTTLAEAWGGVTSKVLPLTSTRKRFTINCRICPIINLCMWCPAMAYLETGQLDSPVDYFCRVAHARKEMLNES